MKSVSVEEALRAAVRMQQQGELEDAERVYRRVLELVPEHPDALHFLGLLARQRGRGEQAIELLERALRAAPDYADAHNNLGNLLREAGQHEPAERCYRRVIELAPGHAGAYNNLGAVLAAQARPREAEQAYREAIALDPQASGPHENLGNLLRAQGRVAEAYDHYCRAVVLAQADAYSPELRALALAHLGRSEEAAAAFRELAERHPQDPSFRFLAAACAGEGTPARAPDDYVRGLFDSFATSFDRHLHRLGYRVPRLIAEALARVCGPPGPVLDVLDAGCGTGLCGTWLRPYARTLEGVDLSHAMLEQAAATGFYDTLTEAELSAHLAARHEVYDLIASADTLCYFGALDEVLHAAARALRAGGWLVFSVELATPEEAGAAGFCLPPGGRYRHAPGYVHGVIDQAGLMLDSTAEEELRRESGEPVAGLIVTARRP